MHFQPAFQIWNNEPADMARDVALPVMNVRAWMNRDSIPAQYWPEVVDAAAKRGAQITLEDLVKYARRRTPPVVSAAA